MYLELVKVVLDALNQGDQDNQALILRDFRNRVYFFFSFSFLVLYFLQPYQKGGSCLLFILFVGVFQSFFLDIWHDIPLLYSPV